MPARQPSVPPRTLSRFGRLLEDRLQEREISVREFARLAQLAHVTVLRIISGEKYLALDRLPGWLDLLQVEGAAREELRVEAIIAACPLQGQALIRELLERPRRRGVRRS